MSTERKYPSTCPHCGELLAISGQPHCPNPACNWLTCRCKANVTQDGDHSHIDHGKTGVACKASTR